MLFTVEVKDYESAAKDEAEVQLHMDAEAIDALISRLQLLQKSSESEHLHLMSESWGLGDLTEEKQGGSENCLVHHLKITKWV